MKHVKSYNEIFSTIGGLLGKGSGKVNQVLPKVSITNKSDKKDNDLGDEILDHLKAMSTDYNRSGNYDEKTINKTNTNWYFFIDTVFKKSNDKYKVDIIKHIDFRTKNVPEYTVIINKVDMADNQYQNRLSGRGIKVRNTEGGKAQMKTYGSSNVQKGGERIKIDQVLAKKIFSEAENIYNLVNKNIRDDARGK